MIQAKTLFFALPVLVLLGGGAGLTTPIRAAETIKTRDVLEIWPGFPPGTTARTAVPAITERSQVAYWPDRIVTGVVKPNITVFMPPRPNGASLIVAPGGAYRRIVLDKESYEMARWLNPHGVTVFLMQYRLPVDGHDNAADVPLQDAQRVVRYVRAHAKQWGLDPNRIGFAGFSAAGHMGAEFGARFADQAYEPIDEIDRTNPRPDYLMLFYPVVTMNPGVASEETRQSLLGDNPSNEMIRRHSPELNVTRNSPPTFIVQADDDPAVKAENAILYADALRKVGVPVELHLFKEGGHGFGIRDTLQLPTAQWPELAVEWLKGQGIIDRR